MKHIGNVKLCVVTVSLVLYFRINNTHVMKIIMCIIAFHYFFAYCGPLQSVSKYKFAVNLRTALQEFL